MSSWRNFAIQKKHAFLYKKLKKMKTRKLLFVTSILFLGLLLQNCKHDLPPEPVTPEDTAQQAFDNADALNGARLYDKFYQTGTASIAGTDFTAPADATVNLSDITDYGNFYRCKQCHGWDQLANTGAYINRGPKSNRPDVSSQTLLDAINVDDILTVFDDIKHTGGAPVSASRTADGTNPTLGGNEMPDYGKILTDKQIWDIVKFLKTRAVDTNLLYDITTTGTYPTGSRVFSNIGKDGDAAAGDTFLTSNCATCHGADGTELNLEGFGLGEYGRLKPYELQHQARNGHLGSIMLGANSATVADIKNMLKALQDDTKYPRLPLTQEQLDQAAYDAADGLNGARLYDKFYATGGTGVAGTNFNAPVDTSINLTDITDFGNFYRCKQCHGWDQLGREGGYINRAPKTNRPDVADVTFVDIINSDPIRTVFNHIKNTGGRLVDAAKTADGTNAALGGNEMPDYGKILTDSQIWDIVKFLKERAIDTSLLYDINLTGVYPTGSRTFTNVGKDGDAAAGDTFLTDNCLSCHGADGNTLNLEDFGLGQYGRLKPYELQHQAVSGHLGSSMMGANSATVDDIKNMLKALQDDTKYPDFTVAVDVSFATDIQPIFDANCVACHPTLSSPDLTSGNSYAAITNGTYIVPGNLTTSTLYQRLLGNGGALMPTTGALSSSDIDLVMNWILQGAQDN
jgi:mono/diheme cytochrome c family protein